MIKAYIFLSLVQTARIYRSDVEKGICDRTKIGSSILNKQAILTRGQSANYETGSFGKIFPTEGHVLDSNPIGSYNFDKTHGMGTFAKR